MNTQQPAPLAGAPLLSRVGSGEKLSLTVAQAIAGYMAFKGRDHALAQRLQSWKARLGEKYRRRHPRAAPPR